ncbi:High-affinity carbon uptake protein Hat/HatR [Olavius sp. associated proteobacterium Delta 1]|nr:High-affinity carbon uptake protein Hat/HatR [Olavius sp. associated proteobacterium Delta 1]
MAENQSSHYHAFLSHNSRDKGSVEPLAVMLKEKGLNPFLDKWNLVPGEPIEDALIEALENSDSAVIFVGPGGEGPWQSEEMRDILKRAVKSHNEFRAIPVLLPNASAEALEKSFLGSRLWIEFKDVDDDDALLRLAKAIQGEASGDESFKLPDQPAPYRGLERFERIEKPEEDFFFGRDDEIRALVECLVQQRFVAVVGASGSGKSSLIRAGLTKQLAEDIHPGIRRWQTITVEPGSAPFRSLAVQVAVAAGIPVADREDWIEKRVEKWTAAPDGVRSSLETLFAGAKEPLLVFIDQFEELFTHRREGRESEAISRNFVANLADICSHGGDRVRVVIALRADFVERCLEIGPLKELLQDHTMLVGEVGDDALREIVKEPTARVGAFLEKGLMERILTEVRNQSGSLPLLQQALHQLWRNRKGAWLTHEAYDAAGGVARALNDQAQGAYQSLNDAQKRIADSLFPRLITLGEGVADTRRRVKRKELYPEGVEPGAVNAVIDTLSGKDARILVTTREGGTAEDLGSGEDFVEFTHEALLGNWDHLVSLLDSERESIRKHRNLTTAAEEWESKPEAEKEKFLLRAGQLVIAEQWAADEGGYARLNQLERRFLKESTQERTAEETRKAKTARRLKMLSIGATAAAVIAMVIGLYALEKKSEAETQTTIAKNKTEEAQQQKKNAEGQRKRADTERDDALRLQSLFLADAAEQQLSKGDAVTGALLALEGLQDLNTSDERQRIRPYVQEAYVSLESNWRGRREQAVLPGHEDWVLSVAFSPDGTRIVTASQDKTARVWDLATGAELATFSGHTERVNSAAFSPDGAHIVTASNDRTSQVWDAATNEVIASLTHHRAAVSSAAFSPDGNRIVTASHDAVARIWDAKTGGLIKQLRNRFKVHAATFSPDGMRIVTASDDRMARIWDVATGEVIQTLEGHTDMVNSAAFSSPDGARVVTASRDHTARVWEAATGKLNHTLEGHRDVVWSAAFSPDGTRIVTASQDATVRFWDAATGKVLETLTGHEAAVNSAAFSPDGGHIVTVSDDKTARVWKAAAGEMIDILSGHTAAVNAAAFSPDGARIVTASLDKTARVWDVATGELIVPLTGHEYSVNGVAFSPDGARIITASGDGEARIWDAAAGTVIHNLDGHRNWVLKAAFNPKGTRVVTASTDGRARLWDTATGKKIHSLIGHEGGVYAATFSPDGTRIVTTSPDKTARIWDAATGKEIQILTGHEAPVNDAAFSPDGARIVTASQDKTARLWDAVTGQVIRTLTGHKDALRSAAFSPDGSHIVTASEDQTARVWSALTGEVIKVLQGHAADVYGAAFSADGARIVTASRDHSARVWGAENVGKKKLIAQTKDGIPRCLTPKQRKQFFLAPEPPPWCIEMGKWPYHTEEWKQ